MTDLPLSLALILATIAGWALIRPALWYWRQRRRSWR
jgi:hypothetical protein